MRIVVDLTKCQDHGQCVFSCPEVFSLDENGKLSFRKYAQELYRSELIAEELRDKLEEAADVCPTQAILIEE